MLRLDGSMSQRERERVIATFTAPNNETTTATTTGEAPPSLVLLISLKAGGVGLNLVAANYVFFLDLWWNPSVEDQVGQD